MNADDLLDRIRKEENRSITMMNVTLLLVVAGMAAAIVIGAIAWSNSRAPPAHRVYGRDGSYFCPVNSGCGPTLTGVQTFIFRNGERCDSVWSDDGTRKLGIRCVPPPTKRYR
jgi:hypothetical protein